MPQVTLLEYQLEWPAHFRAAAAELVAAFAPASVHLEHIGSTAIVGLCAKPVIDIMLGASDLSEVESRIQAIEGLRYLHRQEYEDELPERRYFVRPAGAIPRVHLHAVVRGSASWVRHLKFRDALRADSELASKYGLLKRKLAALHADDKAAYTDAKTPFIENVVASSSASTRLAYQL